MSEEEITHDGAAINAPLRKPTAPFGLLSKEKRGTSRRTYVLLAQGETGGSSAKECIWVGDRGPLLLSGLYPILVGRCLVNDTGVVSLPSYNNYGGIEPYGVWCLAKQEDSNICPCGTQSRRHGGGTGTGIMHRMGRAYLRGAAVE